jgi:REP element-mobilizing transposase RayT
MSLFQNSVINRYLKNQDGIILVEAYEKFKAYFHDPEIQDNIRHSKEEQFQEGFLRELFVKVLGYKLNPSPGFNLTTELKNEKDAKKADGAILKEEKVLAVIELKGTDTKDLGKISDQAFGYKNNHADCVYVVTSNFEKLRFYIHNAVEYLEFDLFNLLFEDFELLWFCLQADNLLQGLPLRAKEESVLAEEQITKQLYKDYSTFKHELWQNMVNLNPQHEALLLFKKTQKLLDRFLFVLFAEDSGLLPPNSIPRMVDRYRQLIDLDAYKPLCKIFQQFFGYINIGRKGKVPQDDIFAYNGGLFVEDPLLDSLKIEDDLLERHAMKLSAYDFESDVDVNILGHIFENSLNEIENITAQLEGKEIDKTKTKRKKDGVFYTPKYITKYIVDHTVGKLCEERKAELEIIDEEYAKGRRNRKIETIKKLDQQLQDYRNWLLDITICDPACGSGAFLNQALDFLIKEHSYIDELESQLLGYSFEFPGVENHILESNLYGVDINEESVEIAKLSLWLRTAQRGRKLTSLNHNIKCGNSLIDDREVAGDKAFSWPKEFPHIFRKKNKKAWHITTATHNSRYSERMKEYNVKLGDPVWLSEKEELIVTEIIAQVAEEDQLNMMAYNICGDHMHMILVCEEEEIPDIVGKLKSMSARAANIAMGRTKPNAVLGHAPKLHRERGETQNKLWTAKYGCAAITSDQQLQNTIHYIETNRQKHELPDISKKLKPYLQQMISSENKAFKAEYKGGFDVVIGNPPYVQLQADKAMSLIYKEIGFKTYDGNGDLYCLFYEKGNELLKNKGMLGYITSSKWMRAAYGENTRNYILSYSKPLSVIEMGAGIFDGATVDSNILFMQKMHTNTNQIIGLDLTKKNKLFDISLYEKDSVNIKIELDSSWILLNPIELSVKTKIDIAGISLKEWGISINFGIKTGFNEAFLIDNIIRDEIISKDKNSQKLIKPLLRGRDIQRFFPEFSNTFLIATFPSLNLNIDEYPGIKEYLLSYGKRLDQSGEKGSRKRTNNKWFETQDSIAYYQDFETELLIWKRIGSILRFSIGKYYCLDSTCIIKSDHNKYFACILNSKMGHYLLKDSPKTGTGDLLVSVQAIEPIKIPQIQNETKFNDYADKMQTLYEKKYKCNHSFINHLQRLFLIEKFSNKLSEWFNLDFDLFFKELEKHRKISANGNNIEFKKLSLSEQSEWLQYFEEQKQKVSEIQTQIDQTDCEIDQMVYELYGLTEEEIKIVEEAIK